MTADPYSRRGPKFRRGRSVHRPGPVTWSQRDGCSSPALKMRPSGATNRRGYHSSARFAVESSRQCVPSHTSGIVSIVMFSSVPPTVSISPSGSVVLVGYHRPTAMGGPTCQERVTGSNRLVLGRPCPSVMRSEEHTSELQSRLHLVCRLL